MKAVAYLRVSTSEQGKSGLGLDAQRVAIESFAKAESFEIAEWHQDVQSGKRSDAEDLRPGLKAAMAAAKAVDGPVIVAKLDRLSRDVEYISGLMNRRVEFIVTELGRQAEAFVLHLFAALAAKERDLISKRTKQALQQAKGRGQLLGMHAKDEEDAQQVREMGAAEMHARALERAGKVGWAVKAAYSEAGTLDGAARLLNGRGVPTARGGKWHAKSVQRTLKYLEEGKAAKKARK
jgi:DNA invertase Pin-like site-specific DNA recombinase